MTTDGPAARAGSSGVKIVPRLLDGLDRTLCVVMGAALVTMVVAVSVQVLGRYLLRDIPVWTEETARYASIWLAMTALPVTIRRRAHIAVDLFQRVEAPIVQGLLKWIGLLTMGLVLAVIAVYGYRYLGAASRQISGGLGIPMSYVYVAAPIGSTCSFAFLLELAFSRSDSSSNEEGSAR